MENVFLNFIKILKYFTPKSYLDIGAYTGRTLTDVLSILPSIEKGEMIEASRQQEEVLKYIESITGFKYQIEVLSDSIKEVDFYIMGDGKNSTGTGNSYYQENTPHFKNAVIEKRITNTLDNIYDDSVSFDLIKIDTQGSEVDILKGGTKLVSRAKGIVLEENAYSFNIGAPISPEVKAYMESIGFELVDTLEEKNAYISDFNDNTVHHQEFDNLYIRKDILNG